MIAPGSLGSLLPLVGIGIISGIGAVVSWIVGAVADIAAAVAAALAAVWAALTPVLLSIWHALEWSFDTVIKPAWDKLKQWGEQVWQAYNDHIKPIVDWVQRISKVLRKVYETFIQPFRDLISLLEQFLQLTGLANTAFGRWLDGELHRLDGVIATMWAELTRPINLLLHLVNEVILDARGILQAPLLLESTATYMGTISSQFIHKAGGALNPDWGNILDAFHKGPRIKPSFDQGQQLIQGNDAALANYTEHAKLVFDQLVADDYEGLDYTMTGTGPSSTNA